MAADYKTPGVYIEEVTKFPPSVAQVDTAIPAFVGHTERADRNGTDLTMIPTRITSLLEYEQLFGVAQREENIEIAIEEELDLDGRVAHRNVRAKLDDRKKSKHVMYYALQMFYMNGGGPCYIVSVGGYERIGSPIDSNKLMAGLSPLEKEDEVTLLLFPEGQNVESEASYHSLQQQSLAQCGNLKNRFAVMDIYNTVQGFRDGIGNRNLSYGAAYYPNLQTTLNYEFDASKIKVLHTLSGGPVKTLPPPPPPPAESDSGKKDKPGDKPADKPIHPIGSSNKGEFDGKTLSDVNAKNNSIYTQAVREIRKLPLTLAPSSTAVGIYAAVDASRGVWKAPANVTLNSTSGVSIKINDAQQESLNVDTTAGKSINAMRVFTGRGIMLWGARTLAGNDNEWRYVSVRRFFIMIEESVKRATMQFVFEPNDSSTWIRVRAMIENYLTLQWRAGALAGSKANDAFYVKVGLGETMTALDILEGRLIIEIGMAVVRPAEFIILRFSHKMQES